MKLLQWIGQRMSRDTNRATADPYIFDTWFGLQTLVIHADVHAKMIFCTPQDNCHGHYTIHKIGVSPEREGWGTKLVERLLLEYQIKECQVLFPNIKSSSLLTKLGKTHNVLFYVQRTDGKTTIEDYRDMLLAQRAS